MKYINKFFFACSGVPISIIKRYPTEGPKYAGIGATIFFTGILAGLAAAYAVYTVFDNYYISTVFGLLWGAMIFNLDRFIVSSMRKSNSKNKEWWMAMPRIILALIIAVVISKPLELKIFEKEIENELVLLEQELRAEQEAAISNRYTGIIAQSQTKTDSLNEILNRAKSEAEFLNQEAIKEADGTGGTGQRNAGPIYRLKKKEAEKAEGRLDSIRQNNKPLLDQELIFRDSIDNKISQEKASIEGLGYNGFAGRMEALSRITKDSTAVWWAELFIMLLFIAIECAPIFVKLMSSKGPTDDRLQMVEFSSHVIRTAHISRESDQARKGAEKLGEVEKNWLNEELLKTVMKSTPK